MSTEKSTFIPAYLKNLKTEELLSRVEEAQEHLSKCDLCAWECQSDRNSGSTGVCHTGKQARIASYGPHLGEEDPLRGWRGSGTIFFSRCNMRCQFCQNYDISQADNGDLATAEDLAAIMLELQERGCHNINLVSPSHVIPQILAATVIAAQAGLQLPLVYNTGGYDSLFGLKLMENVVDIYMPDMKYASAQIARHYSRIPNYPQVNQAAVKEMHRQVGDLQIGENGLATRGLLVRHLILPHGLAGTEEIIRFLADEISSNTYLNLMDQYRPAYNVQHYPNKFSKLRRGINQEEHGQAIESAHTAGLYRLD